MRNRHRPEARLSPYIGQMRVNMAEALRLETDQVSVKATAEERLGLTGAEEGICAQAVCLPTNPFDQQTLQSQAGCGGCPGCEQRGQGRARYSLGELAEKG